jgi:Protein of unknown function (DUF2934)
VKLVSADTLRGRRAEINAIIGRRAYELFKSRGGLHGRDVEDWMEAESELLHTCASHNLKESADAVVFRAELPRPFQADRLASQCGTAPVDAQRGNQGFYRVWGSEGHAR